MTTLHVSVTKEDIERGERRDCARCPVAVAMSRAAGRRIDVSLTEFWFVNCEPDAIFFLPRDAVGFVDKFDDFGTGEPFEFDVEVP